MVYDEPWQYRELSEVSIFMAEVETVDGEHIASVLAPDRGQPLLVEQYGYIPPRHRPGRRAVSGGWQAKKRPRQI